MRGKTDTQRSKRRWRPRGSIGPRWPRELFEQGSPGQALRARIRALPTLSGASTRTLANLAATGQRWRLRREGAQSRWFESASGRIHGFDIPGEGPLAPLVMLHGMTSAATDFEPLVRRLKKVSRRLIVLDEPAHGRSDTPVDMRPCALQETMIEVLDQVTLQPSILVGCSLGGAIALRYAIERPDRVKGLFVMSPAGAAMSATEREEFFRILEVRTQAEAHAFIRRVFHRTPRFRALIARELRRRFSSPAMRRFLDSATADDEFTPEELASLKPPTQLIWGRSDQLFPPSHVRYFSEHLPDHVRIVRPAHFGHAPYVEFPDEVAKQIVCFARELGRAKPKPNHVLAATG